MYFDMMAQRDFDVAAGSISALTPDPDFVFGDFFTCEGGSNNTGICQPSIDELFQQQSQTMDPEARLAMVHDLEEMTLGEYAFVPVFFRRKRIALSNRVKNLVTHPEPTTTGACRKSGSPPS